MATVRNNSDSNADGGTHDGISSLDRKVDETGLRRNEVDRTQDHSDTDSNFDIYSGYTSYSEDTYYDLFGVHKFGVPRSEIPQPKIEDLMDKIVTNAEINSMVPQRSGPHLFWLRDAYQEDDQLHGPPESLDVVATQGRYLRPCPSPPRTPMKPPFTDEELENQVRAGVIMVSGWRVQRYGSEVAELWPIDRTPLEIKSVWQARMNEPDDRAKDPTATPVPFNNGDYQRRHQKKYDDDLRRVANTLLPLYGSDSLPQHDEDQYKFWSEKEINDQVPRKVRCHPTWLKFLYDRDEQINGPIANEDIVATQGAHLRVCPSPWIDPSGHKFDPESLVAGIERSILKRQQIRKWVYGLEVAEMWPVSHTPKEIKAVWRHAESERIADGEFRFRSPECDSSCSCDLPKKIIVPTPNEQLLEQLHELSTSLVPFSQSSSAATESNPMPRGLKRKRSVTDQELPTEGQKMHKIYRREINQDLEQDSVRLNTKPLPYQLAVAGDTTVLPYA